MRRHGWTRAVATVAIATSVACAGRDAGDLPTGGGGTTAADSTVESASPAPGPSPSGTTDAAAAPTPSTPPGTASPTPTEPAGTPLPIRVESRVEDVSTAEFRQAVAAILADARGWQRAGFRFVLGAPDAPHRLILAEGPEVDELCLPLDTYGLYSCQNGPVVALNADRWRTATPEWTGTLEQYRVMLVNHEVGHLLHLHHPVPQCPGEGLPAPVMAQQSTELGACTTNPWPLRWEVDLAAEQREPLAPPADHDTRDHQPSPPPATE